MKIDRRKYQEEIEKKLRRKLNSTEEAICDILYRNDIPIDEAIAIFSREN